MADYDFLEPVPGTQPPHLHPAYRSTAKRAPMQAPIRAPSTLSELSGPDFSTLRLPANAADLTRQHTGQPIGERIVVSGRVLDENGRPLRKSLVEIWQCNAAGRYAHDKDTHDAPLDPNFSGRGHTLTDDEGRYCFVTIRPGAYPWRNHANAWRPAHLHFSLFGPAFLTRLVTQMYFPGDPLLAADPIFNCIPDARAQERLIAEFDWQLTRADFALGYRFDLVLRGRDGTPMENESHGG